MINDIPRESVEFRPVTIKVDGTDVTSGVTLAVIPAGTRPQAWAAPTIINGKIGFMVDGLAVGTWDVWAKVVSDPETPVLYLGSQRVS